MTKLVIYGLKHIQTEEYRYVGQTSTTIEKRLQQHKTWARSNKRQNYVHNWMNSIGLDNVVIEVLEICSNDDNNLLNDLEIKWIKLLKTSGCRLTNLTDGGSGSRGHIGYWNGKHISAETKEKLRQANLGKTISEETRKNMSIAHSNENNGFYGKKHTEETIEKLRQNHTGKNNVRFGKKHTEETIIKMQNAQAGEKHQQFGKRGKDTNAFGHIVSQEMRQHLSEVQKGKPSVGMHVRWHVKRDIINVNCIFCNQEKDK